MSRRAAPNLVREKPVRASATGQERDVKDGGPQGRWSHTYAALDLGTNNCRLLVAKPDNSGFHVVDAFSRIVRLGEGLGSSNALSHPAMDRTIDALRVCRSKIDRNGVTRIRAVATEACRRADNGAEFVSRVRAETDIALEIIAPDEEAELALVGCSPLYDAPSEAKSFALLFDIGGGSTQITWLELEAGQHANGDVETRILGCISIPCGVVTLSEKFGSGEDAQGRSSPARYAEICDHVRGLLAPFDDQYGISARVRDGAVQMVGTSGTVTTLTGVYLKLPRYDRGRVDGRELEFGQLEGARDTLLALDRDDRAAHPCIGLQRADLVIAGCAILDAICDLWPVGRLRVADRGLREGILHGLMRSADRESTSARN
ncbi:MAG: Ppx/GppA family phosphatase [Alphaproteobacteria bacterium]|nr:Ppx/GppA family phosphatase [Alphaproteobacteria bacterium]